MKINNIFIITHILMKHNSHTNLFIFLYTYKNNNYFTYIFTYYQIDINIISVKTQN